MKSCCRCSRTRSAKASSPLAPTSPTRGAPRSCWACGLRYTDARSSAPNRPPPKPWQKIAYGAVTVGGRYAWTKWEEHLLSTSEDYTRPESPQLKLLSRLSELAGSAHDIASLASFLVFLVNGRYRTMTDRLLRLRLTPTSHSTSREVSFEYLNRQLVWHAFTEFLLFLLPLVGISRWRRILARSWRKLRSAFLSLLGRSPKSPSNNDNEEDSSKTGELSFLPERTCAICYRDANPIATTEADILASSSGGGVVGSAATDITNPYETVECGCLYCFACIAQRIANEEGEGWTCLRCGETVKQCKPWSGDILEPQLRPSSHDNNNTTQDQDPDRPMTAKSVGFAPADASLEEKISLRHVDPMPDSDPDADPEDLSAHTTTTSPTPLEDQARIRTNHLRGLDLADSLFTESSEWARASEASESECASASGSEGDSGDQQSEEYEEDEEEEGEELGGYEL
ncbi:hypothetical protein LEMA_P067450.1 [Plenodomus lingam JN3]|uniref:Pex N-terminal domain-containing protein n=1 Tax=Leptosphaeria maculans (strain JN3 / isolate v23.1.3 / race Av1-4-5-6-7-8) TaxID=985895 RepID=E4ZIW7_LEPMJ|nr:hypothetical protein LEMA_P067450.1 [Plenodomus lingam JN3]CBX91237.1 hypothetical protein LEMA_P067450.1 [Plenodomus lingam JN3]